ncbi:MAG: NAD(P)-binding domain-containing protein [Methylococcales bacterium]|nr:NAD(P)-binding domain-containing protein [Methylococcales bacterium]
MSGKIRDGFMLSTFIEKINHKEAIIAVVGLGYVGLPLMLRFAEVGYRVIGIDVNENKNTMLNGGQSYIQHISSEKILAQKSKIAATSDFEACIEADAIILCVPTPLNKYREPDLSYLQQSMAALLPHLRAGQLVSLESTTYPGTTQEELKPRIESR